jgi:hypothetical protein
MFCKHLAFLWKLCKIGSVASEGVANLVVKDTVKLRSRDELNQTTKNITIKNNTKNRK